MYGTNGFLAVVHDIKGLMCGMKGPMKSMKGLLIVDDLFCMCVSLTLCFGWVVVMI